MTVFDPTAGICGRTEQVRTAILARISGVTALRRMSPMPISPRITGSLDLRNENITALAAGDFDGLTALTSLWLQDNSLSTLPDDVFDR